MRLAAEGSKSSYRREPQTDYAAAAWTFGRSYHDLAWLVRRLRTQTNDYETSTNGRTDRCARHKAVSRHGAQGWVIIICP